MLSSPCHSSVRKRVSGNSSAYAADPAHTRALLAETAHTIVDFSDFTLDKGSADKRTLVREPSRFVELFRPVLPYRIGTRPVVDLSLLGWQGRIPIYVAVGAVFLDEFDRLANLFFLSVHGEADYFLVRGDRQELPSLGENPEWNDSEQQQEYHRNGQCPSAALRFMTVIQSPAVPPRIPRTSIPHCFFLIGPTHLMSL